MQVCAKFSSPMYLTRTHLMWPDQNSQSHIGVQMSLAKFWLELYPIMAKLWLELDPILARLWTESDPILANLWIESDPIMAK